MLVARLNYIGLTLVWLAFTLSVVARAADFVIVVSAKSPVRALSKSQVADIFLGKSIRFPDGAQAIPIDQPELSSLRVEFYITIAGKSAAQLKAHWSKIIFTGRGHPPKIAANSVEVKKQLSENPYAIGYIAEREVDSSVKVLDAP